MYGGAVENFFDISGLAPHGNCLLWRPAIFWSLVGSDLAIALAYVSISSLLVAFIVRRRDVSLRGVGALFAAFILLCAASHLTDIWTMWVPEYGVQALIKFGTAAVSLGTAVLLWGMLPDILALPSVKQMSAANEALSQAQENLEMKVADRTRELEQTSQELRRANVDLANSNEQLELARAELERLVQHDNLTKVWNRNKIIASALQEMQMLSRYGHPVSLIFIDLDHFKQVNDCFGHSVGDDVLVHFCDIASQCMRSTDILGRWGGEEFLIVTPNTGLMVAVALAERICDALTEYEFPVAGHLSASFGVATCRVDENWESWLSRADSALYNAKKMGRSRVVADLD